MISRLAVNCFGAAQHAACAALIGAGRAADDASLLRPRQQKSSLLSLVHTLPNTTTTIHLASLILFFSILIPFILFLLLPCSSGGIYILSLTAKWRPLFTLHWAVLLLRPSAS